MTLTKHTVKFFITLYSENITDESNVHCDKVSVQELSSKKTKLAGLCVCISAKHFNTQKASKLTQIFCKICFQ